MREYYGYIYRHLRWALAQAKAQAPRSRWELHSANARGQAAARKEEQYKCCPQIKAYLVSLSLLPSHDKPVLS